MSTTVYAFNTEDLLDFCVQIINTGNKQGKEIVVRTPQIWKIVQIDNLTTIHNYEVHITFKTPNRILKVHIHVDKYETQNFMVND